MKLVGVLPKFCDFLFYSFTGIFVTGVCSNGCAVFAQME